MGPLLLKQSFLYTILLLSGLSSYAQPNTTINLDSLKPKQYDTRKLRSERTGDTKLSPRKKFIQNTFTHYNYFFNANNKLNEIVARAKSDFKEDYTQLLPFYNYTLSATAQQKQQLDSVVYKCNAGLLLHDLRSDWTDDMYLLLGKAYLFKELFDSATQVFQYINYAYAPKDDGYDLPIGSNASNNSGVFSIATQENNSFFKKITSKPPSRNESFIWQCRNYLEQNKINQANGLLAILINDPKFPARLRTDLNEMIAYSYYKQSVYDSAGTYLQKSLSNAEDNGEKGRREFLAAQLFQKSGNTEQSKKMFNSAINHTIDPYLDVYARLNIVNLTPAENKLAAINNNLQELYKLIKKDKYEGYRDILYYAAAVLEKQLNNTEKAIGNLKKSLYFNQGNTDQKQKSFLLLADIDYETKKYIEAAANYDSLKTSSLKEDEKNRVDKRLAALKVIAANLNNIHLQDSLLNLAAMSESERMAAIKKIYRQLRKEQGLKELPDNDFGTTSAFPNSNRNLFGNSGTNANSFYFLNTDIKTQGYRDFKTNWGNRPNVDNWQRKSAIANANNTQPNPFSVADVDQLKTASPLQESKQSTMEGLLLNIPLNDKRKKIVNDSIAASLYSNGLTFENKLEEFPSAIEAYHSLLIRYPDYKQNEKAMYSLAHCYLTTGNNKAFDSLKTILNNKYPDGIWTYKINKGEFLNNNDSSVAVTSLKKEYIAKQYEHIYTLFIEGSFEEAKNEKLLADNSFGNKYWTPQLLYIESVYYVKKKQDSIAINRLQSIVSKFPKDVLAEKAKTMIDVLKRRKEIESYLTSLQIDSASENVNKRVDLNKITYVTIPQATITKDTLLVNRQSLLNKGLKYDNKPLLIKDSGFSINPSDPHFVVLVLSRVDPTLLTESKNAFNRYNKDRFPNEKTESSLLKLNEQFDLLLMGPFNTAGDAMNYVDNVSPSVHNRIIPWLAPERYYLNIISLENLEKIKKTKDISDYTQFLNNTFPDKFDNYIPYIKTDPSLLIIKKPVDLNTVSAQAPKPALKSDTVSIAKQQPAMAVIKPVAKPTVITDSGYAITPADPHYVVLILTKVDEVFVNESKNAFSRFNRDRFNSQKIDLMALKLNPQTDLLLMGPFNTAGDAMNYLDNVKASVNTRIIPWLTQEKYYLNIISNTNLEKVKAVKNISGYSKFLKQTFPDKF
jgi:outer membrane protein assembly factor BamD (BamD/ComL family)